MTAPAHGSNKAAGADWSRRPEPPAPLYAGLWSRSYAAEPEIRRCGSSALRRQRLPLMTQPAKCPTARSSKISLDFKRWNVTAPKDSVQVKVENGWVTLTGQVDWWYQQEAAENDIRPLHGVVGVSRPRAPLLSRTTSKSCDRTPLGRSGGTLASTRPAVIARTSD